MRIGVLSPGNPDNVRTWSGVPFFMTRQLQRFAETIYLPSELPRWDSIGAYANRVSRRLFGRQMSWHHLLLVARHHRRRIQRLLMREDVDLIFTISVDQQVAFLETDIPIVHHSDATFTGVEEYYSEFVDLWGWSRASGHEITRRAISNADLSIYPSRWSADSAISDYGADPTRVHVLPYGANLQSPPDTRSATDIEGRTRCQLVFIGSDWHRKGGDLAFETMTELVNRGVNATLVVVGCRPPHSNERLIVYPFLDKQNSEQLRQYQAILRKSAFLCQPTRAETFGAIFAEAAAYGVPSVTNRTGGVVDAVDHGKSGFLLPPEARGDQYADVIEAVWSDRERYHRLVRTTRDRFDRVLNWDSWGDRVEKLINDMISKGGRP
jgi:glycosyltransferase involved in cell wall biosynthesis